MKKPHPVTRVIVVSQRFVAPIVARTKTQTIRQKTRAKPGDMVSIRAWEGRPYRSLQREIVCGVCVSVDPIRVEVAKSSMLFALRVEVAGVEIPDTNAFARADGFLSAVEMATYYVEKGTPKFDGVLIRWMPFVEAVPVKPEPIIIPSTQAAERLGMDSGTLTAIMRKNQYEYTEISPGGKPGDCGPNRWGLTKAQIAVVVKGQAVDPKVEPEPEPSTAAASWGVGKLGRARRRSL